MAKRKLVRKRRVSGYEGGPDKNFRHFCDFVRNELDGKYVASTIKTYVKQNVKKDKAMILSAPDWIFKSIPSVAASIEWVKLGRDLPDNWNYEPILNRTLVRMKQLGAEKVAEKKRESKLVKRSAQDVIRDKQEVFLAEIEDQIDNFFKRGYKIDSSFSVFTELQKTEMPQTVAKAIVDFYQPLLDELESLANKPSQDMKEAYSHIKKGEYKNYVTFISTIIDDAEKYADIKKAKRAPRKRTVKAVPASKIVSKLNYKVEDNDYRIASINPEKLLGANVLFTFNTKTRVFTEYVASDEKGLSVKGSTLQNVDLEKSQQKMVRKPQEFLDAINKTTVARVRKIVKELTTKATVPNARINKDTILLRVT